MGIKIVKQPKGSTVCGQACVAMVANIPLRESIEIFGHTKSTGIWDIIKALNCLDIQCDFKLRYPPSSGLLPEDLDCAILKIIHGGDKTNETLHWCIYYKGKVYDPYPGITNKPKVYTGTQLGRNWHVVSYLRVDLDRRNRGGSKKPKIKKNYRSRSRSRKKGS